MKIKSITINHFGAHKDTSVTFSDGLTGIIGSNGTGKSFLIEAIPACLFGTWPSRGIGIIDGITNDFTGDAYIKVEFEYCGFTYIAERKIRKTAKTTTHEAMLLCNGEAVAGPKVQDFEKTVAALFNKDVFFSSLFSAQNGDGDFINCSSSERKSILVECLGLHRLQEKSDGYKKLQKIKADELEKLNHQIEALEGTIKAIPESIPTDKLESELVAEKLKLLDIEKIQRDVEQAEKNRKSIADEVKVINANITELEKQAAQQFALSFEIPKIEAELKQQKEDMERNKKAEEANARRNEFIAENNRTYNEWISSCRDIESKNSQTKQRISEFKSKIDILSLTIEQKRSQDDKTIESLQKRVDLLSNGDFTGENCAKCQFLEDARQADIELRGYAKYDSSQDERTIESLKKEMAGLREETLPAEPEYLPLPESIPVIPVDLSLAGRLAEARLAESRLKDIKVNADGLEKRRDVLKAKFESFPVVNLEQIEHDWIAADLEIKSLEKLIEEGKRHAAFIQAIEAQNEEANKKIAGYRAKVIELEHSSRAHEYLARAFSKSGIQALIMDSALPSIENLANEYLKIATDGAIRLRISTQKELKSGDLSESLEILTTDINGTRDVSHMSGGEQKVIKALFRLAFSVYNSNAGNVKMGCVVMDELFENMDADRIEQVLKVIKSLRDIQIIIVSHGDFLDVDTMIRLEKKGGFTHVIP